MSNLGYPSSHQGGPKLGLVPFPESFVRRYREAGYWTGRTLPAELQAARREHGSAVALVTPEGVISYNDLFDEAETLAAGLLSTTSLAVGDAVMFQMGNVRETVVAYLGSLFAGLKPVCTLPQHSVREIGLLAEHLNAKGLFVQADFGRGQLVGNAKALLDRGAISEIVIARGESFDGAYAFNDILDAGSAADVSELPYEDLPLDDVAVFQLSGGTTGLPKVAPRLHEDYTYNSRAWAETLGYGPETVILYPLPVMHNAGISLAIQPGLLSGSSIVLAPSADVAGLIDLIESERPDVLPLVPPALAIRLLEEPRARTADLSSIRDFIVGGQVLPVAISERLRDVLGIRVRQMFGMAEGMFTITPALASEEIRHNTVGNAISEADEIRILEPGFDVEVQRGEIGELCARGPYTIRGYYRAEAHNAAAFNVEGFYRTGDLAREHVIEGRSYFSIEGRIKDVINRGTEKIHAEEVEELIVRHPDVVNAALVAMPDEVFGEKACVYLILESGSDPIDVAGLAQFLTSQGLAKYKLPERVEIVPSFPVSNVGKVSKKDLRADVEAKLANQGAHQ